MMTLQSSSLPSLPWDLVEEILARVPTISLKRLRSTCKRWNVLFNDKRFTQKHFDKAEKQFMFVMLRHYKVCSLSVNLHGLDDNIDPSIEVKSELSLVDPSIEVFHCNGLLLCITPARLVVWNPCTGQTRWIQTEVDHYRDDTYALGYENKKSCYNYKILKVCVTRDLEIYDFNSNSWSILGTNTSDFRTSLKYGVSLKGNTYWITSNHDFLICFDFTRESFRPRMCLPFKGYYHDIVSLSCVREERLSIFFQDYETIEIWMSSNITETEVMSWSQFFKIDLNTHIFLPSLSFFIDEENKVIVCCDGNEEDVKDIVYIIGEDHQYWREVDIGRRTSRPRILSYVPSLVQI